MTLNRSLDTLTVAPAAVAWRALRNRFPRFPQATVPPVRSSLRRRSSRAQRGFFGPDAERERAKRRTPRSRRQRPHTGERPRAYASALLSLGLFNGVIALPTCQRTNSAHISCGAGLAAASEAAGACTIAASWIMLDGLSPLRV